MDKDGTALSAWHALGFGFVEVGTVTPCPQAPNDGLRLVRVPSRQAIVNRMGFNNDGAQALAGRLASAAPRIPVGLSIGKGRTTPLAGAIEDYLRCLRVLHPHGDYAVLNISSPNTAGLTSLQDRAYLHDLLQAVSAELRSLGGVPGGPPAAPKPYLVKVSPDLPDAALADLLELCLQHRADGLVATNTTTSRLALATHLRATVPAEGGLSGAPLAERVRQVVAFIRREAGDELPVIGVGGVTDVSGGLGLLDAGATLVQLYTGLVYRGPGLVRGLARAIASYDPSPRAASPSRQRRR
jgi:dihydroorotate dehydrogenase